MGKKKQRGAKTFLGVAGEYYVAAELSRLNVAVTITSKNTPDIDILASKNSRLVNIQVKTGQGDTGGFIVGSKPMKPMKRTFYTFVLLKGSMSPQYWVIPQRVVARIAEQDYQRWITGRSKRSQSAPRTFRWKHLKSKRFQKHHNNWKVLGIL